MKVIAVLNQKGGAGKTTVATNLSRAIQLLGHTVLLADSDPQGSARDWAAANEAQPVPVAGFDRASLDRDIKSVARDVDYVVIDGAPQIKELAVAAIRAADLVLIPIQPSPYDIWAASDLVDRVKARIDVTDGRLKAGFVVSRAIKGTKLGREISEALTGYELPVLDTVIYQRQIYPTSASSGVAVADCDPRRDQGADDAAIEIRKLAKEALALLSA